MVEWAKAANLPRDPQVALYGTVRLNDDPATAQADTHWLATRYWGRERADQAMLEQFGPQRRLTMRLTVERVVEHL